MGFKDIHKDDAPSAKLALLVNVAEQYAEYCWRRAIAVNTDDDINESYWGNMCEELHEQFSWLYAELRKSLEDKNAGI